jgi:hypothetical protein
METYGILIGKMVRNFCGNMIKSLLLLAWDILELTYFRARKFIPRQCQSFS